MKTLQVVGPFATNYSLARVNRGLAKALDQIQDEFNISLFCEKDRIDWYPTEKEFTEYPEVKKLFRAGREETDVVIYNNFPKTLSSLHGLADLPGKIKLMYIAWEESVYPKIWVDEINQNLHGIMAATSFVKEILQKCGVRVPIVIIPNAIDDEVRNLPKGTYPINTKKKFKFFHLSTAKQRKGVDVLLKAYFSEFTKDDDVTMVIKSFPGPDNLVDPLLNELKTENSPEVVHINNPDLTEQELKNLHASIDCEVYPSRAEGFGLPILEAMYLEKPVIATNYSGYLDFCDEESSFMIDYKLEYAKDSEFVNIGAMWAEPDQKHLQKLMREVFETSPDDSKLIEKLKIGKSRADAISWENSAKMTLDFIHEIAQIEHLKEKNAVIISLFNDETGIADYTEDLYKSVEHSFKEFYYLSNKDIADRSAPDGLSVVRTWSTGESDWNETIDFIKSHNIQIVHIQYHSGGHYAPESLDLLLQKLHDLKIETFVTLHSVKGPSFDYISSVKNLKLAKNVFIHNKNDYDHAIKTLDNAYLMTLPTLSFKRRNKKLLKQELVLDKFYPIVATHGLLNVNKGVPNVLEAVKLLNSEHPNILFLGLTAVSSNNIHSQGLYEQLLENVKKYNLENNAIIVKGFLDDPTIEVLLQSSDVNVLAYIEVGETSSAAVRKCLASLNSTIVTNINMFSELSDQVFKVEDNAPQKLAYAIKNILNDKAKSTKIIDSAKKYIQENSYDRKAIETLKLY